MANTTVVVSMLLVGLLLFGCASTSPQDYTTPAQNYTQNNAQNYTPDYSQNNSNPTSPDISNPTETYKGGPISIKGDDEFTAANGVVSGSGTPSDPYIMEGWTIDASSSNASIESGESPCGISLFQTSKYFVIRNCLVKNAGRPGSGIELIFASNGKIENCTFTNNYDGISLSGSDNTIISGNTIENCGNGVEAGFYSSDNVTVSNNVITNCNGSGVYFNALTNCHVLNNTIRNKNGSGIHVSSSMNCTISNNIVQGNENEGIDVSESGWEGGDNNIISNNDVSGNGDRGIRVYGSYDIISHNTVNGNNWGIDLENVGLMDIAAGHNIVSNNTASNNRENGFYLCTGCVGNIVTSNTFVSNNADNEYFDNDYFGYGGPRWYDMYIDNKNNVFKDNTYGTILMSPSAQ